MFTFDKQEELLIRKAIVELVLRQEGKRYEWGSRGPDTFDCAGLTWYIYYSLFDIDITKNGIGLSTTTRQMTSTVGKLTLFNECDLDKYSKIKLIKPGDVVFFHRQSLKDDTPEVGNKYPGHCGIYLGNNDFIHAPRNKQMVVINNFKNNSYWLKKLVASKNIVDDIKIKIKK